MKRVYTMLVVVVAAGCPPPPPSIACGADTLLVNGECVSTLPPITCAPGTSFDGPSGECRPSTVCAEGTSYDAAKQECISDTECGDGTTLDEDTGVCVANVACGAGTVYDAAARLCLPAAICAEGTELDPVAQDCVPVNVCGPGTVRDSVTNLCVPVTGCGPGLVEQNATCISPEDILLGDADAIEPINDDNDPAFGGTPEVLVLEGAGEPVIFAGVIGRPVDLDGDGDDDQDRDLWAFDAVGSAALRLRVLSDGLPEPAFRVTGPDGYVRLSRTGDLEPLRELVLPRSGTYTIEIAPGAQLRDALAPQTGSPDHRYIAILEEIPFPASSLLSIAPLPQFVSRTGALLDLSNNAVAIDAQAGTSLMWTASVTGGNTTPVLLLFDADRRFLDELELDETILRGATLQDASDLIVLFDWRDSGGTDTSFSLTAAALPEIALGTVGADDIVERPRVLIAGGFGAAFRFSASAGQVVTTHLSGIGTVSATLSGPNGVVDVVDGGLGAGHDFYARVGGDYVWAVVNRSTSDANVSPGISSSTPIDTGPLATGAPPQLFSGDDLGPARRVPRRAFVVVENAAPAIVRARASFAFGMPDLKLARIAAGGALVERRAVGEDGPVVVAARRAEPALSLVVLDPINLDPPNPVVRDWTLDVSLDAAPLNVEVEPNDDDATATAFLAPGEISGTLVDDAIDRFRVTLAQPLAGGTALDVQVQNLTTTSTTILRISGGAAAYQASTPLVSAWRLLPDDGAGPFVVEIEGAGDEEYEYVLSARVVALAGEREPNDNVATAGAALGAGDAVVGRTSLGAPDLFALAPAGGSGVVVRARNEADTDDLRLQLLDETGAVIASSDHEDAMLFAPAASFARVEGRSSSRTDLYRLSVEALGDPLEVEPNDDPLSATPIVHGGGTARILGQGARAQPDVYVVQPDAPLVDGEAFSIRWHALLERGDIQISVHASDQTLALFSEDFANELVFAPIADLDGFFVTVTPDASSTTSRPEPYLLEIERLAVIGEREPNNDVATAQALPGPAARVRAQSRIDEPDVYSVSVGASGVVSIAVSAALRMDDVDVVVRSAAGEVVASGADVDVALDVAAAAGATLFIEVSSVIADADELRVYTLDVSSL